MTLGHGKRNACTTKNAVNVTRARQLASRAIWWKWTIKLFVRRSTRSLRGNRKSHQISTVNVMGKAAKKKIIIDELFRLLDKKNDGHLDKDELLPVAKELGMYDGSPAQGSAFYAAWCDEHSIDPQKGTDQAQFERGILADETVPGVSKLSRAVFNILDTESDHYLTQDEFLYVARQLGIYTGSSADWPKFYKDHCAANNIPAKGISFQNFERVLCKHASVE